MEELYSETYLKAKPSSKRMAARIVLEAVCVLLVVAYILIFSRVFGPMGIAFVIAIDGLIIFFLPSKNIAYEYIFVDGQIDFDMIIKGEKRKTKKRIDLEKVDLIAKENSPSLYNHRNTPLFDFSSGNRDDDDYVLVVRGENGNQRIKFTPDEKMLSNIKLKARMKFEG